MKRRLVWVVVGIVVLLTAGCLSLMLAANFHYANSITEASSATSSSRWPQGEAMPGHSITYAVEGDGPLAEALVAALEQVVPAAELADEGEVPQLIVRFEEVDTSWTPFYAKAEASVTAAVSSNGDFSFREGEPTHFENAGSAKGLQAISEIKVTDQSRGLFSLPGYRAILAERLAQEIGEMLRTQIFAAP